MLKQFLNGNFLKAPISDLCNDRSMGISMEAINEWMKKCDDIVDESLDFQRNRELPPIFKYFRKLIANESVGIRLARCQICIYFSAFNKKRIRRMFGQNWASEKIARQIVPVSNGI